MDDPPMPDYPTPTSTPALLSRLREAERECERWKARAEAAERAIRLAASVCLHQAPIGNFRWNAQGLGWFATKDEAVGAIVAAARSAAGLPGEGDDHAD